MLVEELDRAVDGSRYGDYILAGYSSEVDSLRKEMKLNERELNELVESLKYVGVYFKKLPSFSLRSLSLLPPPSLLSQT